MGHGGDYRSAEQSTLTRSACRPTLPSKDAENNDASEPPPPLCPGYPLERCVGRGKLPRHPQTAAAVRTRERALFVHHRTSRHRTAARGRNWLSAEARLQVFALSFPL